MIAEIQGLDIRSEADFHREIARALSLGSHYGKNLNALWDVLTRDVERPVTLTWKNADASRSLMKGDFEKIVQLLRDVEMQDATYDTDERFKLIIQ